LALILLEKKVKRKETNTKLKLVLLPLN
jgi:hypothetical protein